MSMSDEPFSKALQERRKKDIEKLEHDLPLMEAQQNAFEGEDVKTEKAMALRERIDEARNALDIFKITYKRQLPLQPWEQGRKK
jgi:hypothetical protein